MAAMLAAPRKKTGRLDISTAITGYLRGNTGPHVHQSVGAANVVSEAGRLRDLVAEPLGTVETVQDNVLRYAMLLGLFRWLSAGVSWAS